MWSILVLVAMSMAQAPAEVRSAVWEAVHPALPFPAATARNEPEDGSDSARWIVRRATADEGALVAEVLANPFNRETQTVAVQDMAAIQQEVIAAERRAQLEFDRALSDVHETGTPVTVRGVSLNDEGVAGDRADAESRVTIEVEVGRAEHVTRIEGADAPAIRAHADGAAWVATLPPRTVDSGSSSDAARAHYHPAQAVVYFGATKPTVAESAPRAFSVRATPRAGVDAVIAVIVRGNRALVDEVLAKAQWSRLAR
jgi:hypothetical protein